MPEPPPLNALVSPLDSVSALVFLASDDSDHKPTFEQMIKKQIEILRKQLDEAETNPSVLERCLQDPMLIIAREPLSPSQVFGSKVPKDGAAEVEPYNQDIQSRAKVAIAHGRSFIA